MDNDTSLSVSDRKRPFQLTRTRYGRMVVLANDLCISQSLRTYGEWTQDELDLLLQLLRPGDHAIDVGANLGTLTLPMARAVGLKGSVMAFEPQPRVFSLLAANVVLHQAAHVRLFHAACGAQPGLLEVREDDVQQQRNYAGLHHYEAPDAEPQTAHSGSGLKRQVPVIALDDTFDGPSLKLIKIDAEGMEVDVLRGAQRLISRFRPVLYLENDFPARSPAMIEAVFQNGYEAYWHIAHCFNPNNYKKYDQDIFGNIACINMICLPAEKAIPVAGLTKVSSASEHPRLHQASS